MKRVVLKIGKMTHHSEFHRREFHEISQLPI
jgi:hypothetical protein